MSKIKGRSLYLVQEILWEVAFDSWEPIWIFDEQEDQGGFGPEEGTFVCRDPQQGRPVKLFADKDAAIEFCQECEEEAGKVRNPFLHGDLEDLTSMPPGVFRDWLLEAGIDPPEPTPIDDAMTVWCNWWRESDLIDEQRDRVWEALDRLQYFMVLRVEAPEE
jgi:hypothetical protein